MLHKFVIFETETGRITGTVTGSRRSVAHALPPGRAFMAGTADPAQHRVEHGRIVPIGLASKKSKERGLATRDARARRDRLLADSDWSQLPDAPVDRSAWQTYRAALRDVTEQPGFPQQINWPTKPGREESK
ncbi:tail fiber assembly protein [Thalassovita sp.]|uniref:tail fiber assembly protein n=1 Tax=Thalassovita sp. TaxID=1979401 RepID=UPI002B26EC8C|nr:tail fiber assembly protein [Thalassovita sp.]